MKTKISNLYMSDQEVQQIHKSLGLSTLSHSIEVSLHGCYLIPRALEIERENCTGLVVHERKEVLRQTHHNLKSPIRLYSGYINVAGRFNS